MVLPLLLLVASVVAASVDAEIPRACVGEHQKLQFCNTSLPVSARVEDLLARLPLDEKAILLTARASPRGNMSSIGLPEYNWGANCVHGVRSTCGTNCPTSFPNPVNLSIHRRRDPRWGRNTETPSEDPLVNSKYGVAYTKGLQEGKHEDPRYLQAVVTLKHYVAYSYENYGGGNRKTFNAIVSPYDFADTYFPAFRSSIVDGNAKGVMCSYNSVNGVPACANNELENKLLRGMLGFDGYITSDSGAIEAISDWLHYVPTRCEAARLAILAGTDVNSGRGFGYMACLKELVESNQLDVKVVDDVLRHTLKLRFELGLFDPIEDQPYWKVTPNDVNTDAAKKLSLDLARKSIVLLQNNQPVLPLRRGVKLAVVGPHAQAKRALLGNYLGQMCHGDYNEVGCIKTPFEAVSASNGDSSTTYALGCNVTGNSTAGFVEAVKAVQGAEAVVLFLGIDKSVEAEVRDRNNIDLPAIQVQLLQRVRAVGKPTVVVLMNGGVLTAEDIIGQTDALVEAFYPGFFGAQAMTDILFGDANPGGKLPVTMYRSDYVNTVDMKSMNVTAYPGRSYRYFKGEPVFPFGWGLSYTSFSLKADDATATTAKSVSATMNTTISVVFAYFRPIKTDASGPATLLNKQLFDYRRVTLKPSESTRLSFEVQRSTLALVDEEGNLVSFPGSYDIIITNGVHEQLTFRVEVAGEKAILRAHV
ncbi:family 3 glycoside hydrolase [Phytophthora sojae]|uniref:Family 3 glycoside hydrolase n=1 Tax=Phytophthora sojae (strain P6497) TaxID=1094619 RepID=G4YPM0_PHYSP|nr:family 3 glycoside hydrolase [Phytophthora sojae]EGZ28322.1 family 3 glycoside hydrolase [Phytophthora sojae]|eukprot:XP_009515597.1 family 3 glycoside hydrolase [Phytophthora sojae]